MTTYALDGTTRRPRDSNVVIGGSPLRLFRLTTPASRSFDDIAAGVDITPDGAAARLVDRLVDAGAIHPRPACGAVHGGATSPSSCRPSCSASRRWPRSCAAAPASPA